VNKRFTCTSAFSLIELTVAIGIAAFCLVTVFALLPVAVQANRNATSQTAANNITASVIAGMRGTPRGVSPSAQFAINLPANAASPADPPPCSGTQTLYFNGQGQATSVIGADSRYRLIVTFVRNPTGATAPTYARLKVSWPAAVDPCTITPSGSIETFAGFDRN
jgi:type II secretory pathway pseudopilin PulG